MSEKTGWIFHNINLFVLNIIEYPQMLQNIHICSYSSYCFSIFLDYEGRTGMAAIVLKRYHNFNGERLYKHVQDFLPSYAQPRFVRIMVRQ